MGIKSFETFLTNHPRKHELLQSVQVSHQYVIIDGSELIYDLFCEKKHYGRENCMEFRQKLVKYFTSLQACSIKPIVILDGFKFEHNEDIYVQKRSDKILRFTSAASKAEKKHNVRGYFSKLVLKQTAAEMGVPCFMARNNADEDIAALSRFLDAPVLATDSIFCAYKLPAGFIHMKTFNWKNTSTIKKKQFIKAELFQADHFANQLNVNPEVLFFLGIVFDNKQFQKFSRFRKNNFAKYDRQQRSTQKSVIQQFIDWYKIRNLNEDKLVSELMRSLPEHLNLKEEKDSVFKQINSLKNPCLKRDLVEHMIEKIQDPECSALLSGALETIKDEKKEEKPVRCQEYLKLTYAEQFPYWALQLLIQHEWGKPLVHYLPLILSDAVQHLESPQRIGNFLRMVSYQILFKDFPKGIMIKVYDRHGKKYQSRTVSLESFQEEKDMFKMNSTEKVLKKRRSFLLNLLLADEKDVSKYMDRLDGLSDNMKLTLAVTICWINRANPDEEMQKAVTVFFALMQMQESYPMCCKQVEMCLNKIKIRVSSLGCAVNPQVIQWISQWVVLVDEASNLNQILKIPFPEICVGQFFSGASLENLYFLLCEDKAFLDTMLEHLKHYKKYYKQTSDIFEQV